MKQSDLKFALLAVLIALAAACGGNTKTGNAKISGIRDTVYTTVLICKNITNNDYAQVAAMKIIFDTTRIVSVDGSNEIKTVRDSVYARAWWPIPVPDSTGKKVLQKKDGSGDSTTLGWVPVQDQSVIIHDYNKRWPIKN